MIWSFLSKLFNPGRVEMRVFGRTDTGRVRPHNEDSFCILPDRGIMMVADGMGGHNAGEVASKAAIESMITLLNQGILGKAANNPVETEHTLIRSFRLTNEAVIGMATDNAQQAGMGCTFILGFICKNMVYTCHVGDVRCYRFSDAKLTQITNDHTYAAEYEKRKHDDPRFEPTEEPPARNIVSRAIGFPFLDDPECHHFQVKNNDRIILCSDGLWSMLEDKKIAEIIATAATPETACDTLIDQANQAGGKDNITAVVAFI